MNANQDQSILGQQNNLVLNGVANLYSCALELAEHGHTVLSAAMTERGPVITILPPGDKPIPESGAIIETPAPGGLRTVKRGTRFKYCQVEWLQTR